MSNILDRIKALAGELSKEIIDIRRHIHMNPELSFEEFKTTEFICNIMDGMTGFEKMEGLETGAVYTFKGNDPDFYCLALRADIDALPILEMNNVEYKSKNEGVMHACGHDVHAASLIGAAKIISNFQSEFNGTIKFIFQPGEEKLPGGASLLIEKGVLENPKVDRIIGQHVAPLLNVGQIGYRKGIYMASADEVYITAKGKGGHAAMQDFIIDPLKIAARLLLELPVLVGERNRNNAPTVLAFGKIIGEGATNVIPGEVKLEGTLRTLNEEWRSEIHELIKVEASRIAESMGGSVDVNIMIGYPYLNNDNDSMGKFSEAAIEYMGVEHVEEIPITMTAEDFAYYSHKVPACFYRLGIKNKSKGITSSVHNDTFNIDESALEIGMGLMAWAALKDLIA
ncbi:MAG: amidohydrolase [Flavobacteriales bacterium]|nr:amidohydrolase [Flavobacteriales bacterium]